MANIEVLILGVLVEIMLFPLALGIGVIGIREVGTRHFGEYALCLHSAIALDTS
jgi:hypothetical protein